MKPVTMLAAALLLAACDGPRENAGENADFNAGAVGSEDTLRQGPAERLGESQDRAVEAAEDAREARARELEAAADERREAAEQNADALDEEAKRLREQ